MGENEEKGKESNKKKERKKSKSCYESKCNFNENHHFSLVVYCFLNVQRQQELHSPWQDHRQQLPQPWP